MNGEHRESRSTRLRHLGRCFPLAWSHYIRLIAHSNGLVMVYIDGSQSAACRSLSASGGYIGSCKCSFDQKCDNHCPAKSEPIEYRSLDQRNAIPLYCAVLKPVARTRHCVREHTRTKSKNQI